MNAFIGPNEFGFKLYSRFAVSGLKYLYFKIIRTVKKQEPKRVSNKPNNSEPKNLVELNPQMYTLELSTLSSSSSSSTSSASSSTSTSRSASVDKFVPQQTPNVYNGKKNRPEPSSNGKQAARNKQVASSSVRYHDDLVMNRRLNNSVDESNQRVVRRSNSRRERRISRIIVRSSSNESKPARDSDSSCSSKTSVKASLPAKKNQRPGNLPKTIVARSSSCKNSKKTNFEFRVGNV